MSNVQERMTSVWKWRIVEYARKEGKIARGENGDTFMLIPQSVRLWRSLGKDGNP